MVIVMASRKKEDIDNVVKKIEELGYKAHLIEGVERTVIAAIGDERDKHRLQSLESLPHVERVFPILKSFKLAGLHYRGTHIMRHGGCRNLYNQVPDLAVAQQLLGNTSIKTTTIYAKRHKGALTQVAQAKWARHLETGRNWSQTEKEKIKSEMSSNV